MTNLTFLVSDVSPKGNDAELLDRNGGRKSAWCVSSALTDWLIAVCRSNLGATFSTQSSHSQMNRMWSTSTEKKVTNVGQP